MKFVIDAETDQILGAQLLVVESMEVINLVGVGNAPQYYGIAAT